MGKVASQRRRLSLLAEDAKVKVLLVDDQPMVAEGIRRMLSEEPDIELHYCRVPSEAIARARDIEATIILLDLVMPDLDGMTLMRFFRADPQTRDIPIVVLSVKEGPSIKSEAFSKGANDYLVKLPNQIELIARIRAHSRHYLVQQERDAAFEELREVQAELERKNAELERLSSLDGLTGIANRRIFDQALRAEWLRSRRERNEMALILADIDYFKLYNDTYGHQGGDEALKVVARALDSVTRRPPDLVARYGGEEFAVILPNTDEGGAWVIAEELRAAVAALEIPHTSSMIAEHLTLSVGLSSAIPSNGTTAEQLVEAADKALYRAKEEGRDRALSARA